MEKSLKKIFLIVLLGGWIFNSVPQSRQVLNLNLEKAISIALEKNSDLNIAKFNKSIADEKLSEAWGSAVFPEIKGSVNYRRALEKGVFTIETPFFSGTFPIGTDNVITANVTVDQPLFTGALFIAVRIAQTYNKMAEKMYLSSRSQVIANVKQAYYGVLLSKEVLELSKENLELAKENLTNSEVMYSAGVISEYDLVRAKVQVQNLIPEVQSAENTFNLAKNYLLVVMGIDTEEEIEINDTLHFKPLNEEDLRILKEQMQKNNPLISQLNLENQLRDDVVTAQFSQHIPSLYAFGNYQSEAQENDDREFSRWRYIASSNIGLNLKIPIFNGWQTSAKVEQAELDLKIAEENFKKTKLLLNNQLMETYLNLKTIKEKISAFQSTIEQAKLAYDIAEKRFKSGLGTQLELVDAMVSLTRAKVNYYSGIYDYEISSAKLDHLLGKN